MKWITVQGQDREGKGLHYLIHGAHDLQEGERVLVFPSADRQIPYAAAKGLAIEPGTRVVAVPHTKMPWSRITTSIFANDALPPTANFEADATLGYQPFEVAFTDLSYANPPAIAWHWDFGDGGASEEQHPTHIYQGLGWFTVTLTVTNGLGSDYLRKEALIFSGVDFPVDLEAWRSSDTSATIEWVPGANNTHVVICRRHDFYPPHPNNAARVYYGAANGGPILDSGLDPDQIYYYRIWGIRNGILSDGYRSAMVDLPITPASEIIMGTDMTIGGGAYYVPGGVYMLVAGSYSEAQSTILSTRIGLQTQGDFNDGIMLVFIDGVLRDELCMYNRPRGYVYYTVPPGIHHVRLECKGERCSGSSGVQTGVYWVLFER